MPIEAPLTFGQLSTWRSIETFAADRLAEVNVFDTCDLRSRGLRTDAVLEALQCLTEEHESLRTTYHVVDGQPVQRVHSELAPRVEVLDIASSGPINPDEITVRLAAEAFPVTDDPGWRAVLITDGASALSLSLSLSHMVVDVTAIRILQDRLFELAAYPGGPRNAPPQPGPAPRELALAQHGEAWAPRREKAEKYWRRVLTDTPARNLPPAPPRDVEQRIHAQLTSHRLGELAAQSAKMHGVSPQSVYTAMTAAALAATVGRDRVLLSVMCANRFDPAWQQMISTMNQLVPVACDARPDATLVQHLKRTHLNALLSYRHGAYDVDRATEVTRQSPPDAAGRTFDHDCWFNYVDGIPAPAPPSIPTTDGPQPAQLTWMEPARQAGHPFYARVSADGSNWVALALRVDPDLIPPETTLRALRMIVRGIHRSITAPDTTLAALSAADAEPLPADLFPPEYAQATAPSLAPA
jgi:hypothetical protein